MAQMDLFDIAWRTMLHLLAMLPNSRTLMQITGEKGMQVISPQSDELVVLDYASAAFECSAAALTMPTVVFEARYIHWAASCLNDVIQKASAGKPIIIGKPRIQRHVRNESHWVERGSDDIGLNIQRSHNGITNSYVFNFCILFGVIEGYIPTFLEQEQVKIYARQRNKIAERVKLLKSAP